MTSHPDDDSPEITQPFARQSLPTKVEVDPATEPAIRAALPSMPEELDLHAHVATSGPVTVPPHDGPAQRIEDVRGHFARGDFETALAVAEAVLAYDPDNQEAKSFRSSAMLRLRRVYIARLGGSVARVLRAVENPPIDRTSLEPRLGTLFAAIDGRRTVDDVVRVSGAGEIDALRGLVALVEKGLVALG